MGTKCEEPISAEFRFRFFQQLSNTEHVYNVATCWKEAISACLLAIPIHCPEPQRPALQCLSVGFAC